MFLGGTAWLASVNNQPGGADSLANLIAARNIADGRGFVTDFVGDYIVPHALPGPEVTRPPGVPYMIAALYRILGTSLSVHVWVNGLLTLLSAFLVRVAVRADGGDWFADVAGMAMLSVRPPLTSVWNTGPIIFATTAMLVLAVTAIRGRLTGMRLAVACALVTSVGFFMKQTFVLSGGGCAVLLLGTDSERRWRDRIRDCAVFTLLFLTLTSPYWLTNMVRYGEPLYAPIHRFHVQGHYGIDPWYDYYRRVMFDERPLTFWAVVDRIGILNVFRSELNYMRERVAAIADPNIFLLFPAAFGLVLLRRQDWRISAAIATLMVTPLFDSSYWFIESRYLLPLLPCLLFLGWLGVRNYRTWARESMRPELAARVAAGYAALLVGAALYAIVMGWPALRTEFTNARVPTPAWATNVRRLPPGAVVMSDLPPAVAWWASRRAIVTPIGKRSDLLIVLRMYRPAYLLDVGSPLASPPLSAWLPGELETMTSGKGWSLHRIRVRLDSSASVMDTSGASALDGQGADSALLR